MLTTKNLKEIETMLDDGYSYQYIADKFGVSRQRIFQLFPKHPKRVGKPGRPAGSSYIYRNFVKFLEEKDIGMLQFCKESGISHNCLTGIMTGKKSANKTTIDKLLKHTGMKYEELFAVE